jgi:hypothetical protein
MSRSYHRIGQRVSLKMDIPAFKSYFPSLGIMSQRQRDFYKSLETKLDAGEAHSVAGNISYLFVYAYDVLADCVHNGYAATYDRMLQLAELYARAKNSSLSIVNYGHMTACWQRKNMSGSWS